MGEGGCMDGELGAGVSLRIGWGLKNEFQSIQLKNESWSCSIVPVYMIKTLLIHVSCLLESVSMKEKWKS